MLITLNEVKSLLNISDTDNDNFIKLLLPFIEEDVCMKCRDHFIDINFTFFSSNNISFDSSLNSLNYNDINQKDLKVGDTIRIYNSDDNDGIFTIDTINQNSLILNDINEVITENSGNTIYIARVKFPRNLKKVASLMIDFKLKEKENESNFIKKEKIDDYSVELENKSQGYPDSILSFLHNYRQVYTKDLFNTYSFLSD